MRRALAAWDRFWFAPRSTSTLAVLRIVFALVLLGWGASLALDLGSFFGPRGIVPRQPDYGASDQTGTWSLLGAEPSAALVVALYVVFMVAVVWLLIGFHTRVAAAVVFCGLVSFTRRNPFVFNSGDLLLRVLAFYLVMAPAGASLSMDRWRRARRGQGGFWEFPARAMWPVRLMQVQLTVVYLSTLWAKAGGFTWREGTAVSYALRVRFLNRLAVPDLLTRSVLISNLLSYGTLAVELALGVLVWNRRVRPWVLLLGVAFHLAIDYALRVGFFSYAIFVLYLAFIPPETMDAWLWKLRDRFRRPSREPEPLSAVVEVGHPSA
ncbi:MAG: HTTM domain-containing protein [Actinomycetota bacterium]|nr:HTTM domain-containing protein [Actinomycetota bacterium]